MDSLLTTSQAAAYLGYKPNTLEIWRSKGCGPRYYKPGKEVRYRQEDLEAFVDRYSTDPEAEDDAA